MTSAPKRAPSFHDLTQAECESMLARHNVGRIAYTFRDRVDVEPIGYVYADGAMVFRTATFDDGDPVPFRSVVVKLHIDHITGRAARSEEI